MSRRKIDISLLTARTPGGSAAPDCRAVQYGLMTRANAAAFPPLMNEPAARWIRVIHAESFECAFRDELGFAQQRGALQLAQFSGWPGRTNLRSPQDFIGHPVPDSGEAVLHEQDGFDRRFTMSIQELIDKFAIELR